MVLDALSTRLVQVAVKHEASEGVAETLTEEDMLAIYNPDYSADIAKFTRTPVSPTYGSLPGIAGIALGETAYEAELKGSGVITDEPEWAPSIKSCGYQSRAISSAVIGVVTDGPFIPGEEVSNGSGGTGVVAIAGRDGDNILYYVPTAGTFADLDVLTGADSGATATVSGTPTDDVGFLYSPISGSGVPSSTVNRYLDGTMMQIVGARGNVGFRATQVGEPMFLTFAMRGAYQDEIDTPMLSGGIFDPTIPPVFMGVNFSIQTLAACIATLNLDTGNNLSERVCANADGGVLSVWISDRQSNGNTDPEKTLVADQDWYGKFRSGAVGIMDFRIGSTPGNTIHISCPRVEYGQPTEQDRDTVAVIGLPFMCKKKDVSSGNDEILIACI